MQKRRIWTPYTIAFGIPLLMLTSLVILARSAQFQSHPDQLSLAITLDLVLTVPVVYLLLSRGKKIPLTSVMPVLVIGIALGSILLPPENQTLLKQVKYWVLPLLELAVMAFVVLKVRRAVLSFRRESGNSPDFFSTLKVVAAEVVPGRISVLLATEIAIFYYGFVNWRKRELSAGEFFYHQKSGTRSVLAAFLFLIVVETFIAHLVIERWSPLVAWMLSLLSVYTAFQIFGIIRSFSKRPIAIEGNKLQLRYGLLSEASINLNDIEEAFPSRKRIEEADLTQKLSPLKEFESHNFILKFKTEQESTGFYGSRKRFTTLALHIDEPQKFAEALQTARSAN